MLKAILIDDEKWTRTIIRNFGKWQTLGIEIVGEAEDGEEGLDLIDRLKPDIIISDMQMPHMDGVALLKILQDRALHAKIIIVSGFDDFNYMKQAIQSKAFEYLLKPVDATELNAVLERCVREIYLDRKTDNAMIFRKLDAQKSEELLTSLKILSESLQRNELDQAIEVLRSITVKLRSSDIDEQVATRILYEHLSGIVHEQLLLPTGYPEVIVQAIVTFKDEVEKGLSLDRFLDEFSAIIRQSLALLRSNLQKNNRSIIELAQEYAGQHFRENISLETIADHFFISKEYLSNAYKAKYKESLGRTILKLKMEEAKRMLSSGYSHTEIARGLGYQDKAYFYKVFKKYYGCTPSDLTESSN